MDYFEGNFDAFRSARRISSDEEAEAILLGRHNFDNDVDLEERRNAPAGGGCRFLVVWNTHTNKRKQEGGMSKNKKGDDHEAKEVVMKRKAEKSDGCQKWSKYGDVIFSLL